MLVKGVRDYLISKLLVEGSTGWVCSIQNMNADPARYVTVGEYPGSGIEPRTDVEHAMFQIRVRGVADDHVVAFDKARAIMAVLKNVAGVVMDGEWIGGIWAVTQPILLTRDNHNRPIFTNNYRVMKSA